MTQKEYIAQNALGFEGDTFAKERMHEIIKDVDVVIETGTYRGATTKHFSKWCKDVYTIEVKEENFNEAKKTLAGTKVKMYLGSSEKVLDTICPKVKGKKVFMLLDAHWLEYNPLLDELAVIAKHGLKPIIAIHDFKVPGKPELEFDSYGEIVYEWAWIEQSIINIYGKDGFTVEYNSQATGAKRGIIYVFPK